MCSSGWGPTPEGLTSEEAARRLAAVGPNAILSHHARPFAVLARQFRSPLLGLLVATAAVSFFLGERSDALAIGAILAVVAIGMVLPLSPLSHALGFRPLPVGYFGALVAMVAAYLVLVEAAKLEFFRFEGRARGARERVSHRRILRRAGRFTHGGPV